MKNHLSHLRHSLLSALCLMGASLCLHAQPQTDLEHASLRVVYVSSSAGSDAGDGSPEHPYRTIAKATATQNRNLRLRLRRGDTFYEPVHHLETVIVEGYGEGDRPVISGYRILKDPQLWERTTDGLWRLDMSRDDAFEGFPRQRATTPRKYGDVGFIYEADTRTLHGHLVKSKDLLREDWDFYTTSAYRSEDIHDDTFRYLYLRLSSLPQRLKSLCLPAGDNGVANLTDCIVRGIRIDGFSCHGIAALRHSLVEDCEIVRIGGAIQTGTANWVRYGNGVEYWCGTVVYDHGVFRNNYVAYTFDCGSTIQGSHARALRPASIHITGNTFYRCRQAFEHFLQSEQPGSQYDDCDFSGNLSLWCGDNGFSSPEVRDAALLSYEPADTMRIAIRNNTIVGSSYYCAIHPTALLGPNDVTLYTDQYLTDWHGSASHVTLRASAKQDKTAFQRLYHDTGTKFSIIRRASGTDKRLLKKYKAHIRVTP